MTDLDIRQRWIRHDIECAHDDIAWLLNENDRLHDLLVRFTNPVRRTRPPMVIGEANE